MKRGDLYRVRRPAADPKRSRVYVIVSRQALIETRFSTVICAPIHTRRDGLATQVAQMRLQRLQWERGGLEQGGVILAEQP